MTSTSCLPPVFQPTAHKALMAGADILINAIRPTLGPVPRIVAIERRLDHCSPELLDSGGMIAKRIIQLPDYRADMGAMFVRDMFWQLQDQEGDGTATAAVIFQAAFNEGVRMITAGLNARRLQGFLEEGIQVVIEELRRQTRPATSSSELIQVAYTVCQDRELSELLGEIFAIIGSYGRLEVREDAGRGLTHEYVEGTYWERGLISQHMVADVKRMRSEMEDAALVFSDLRIRHPQDILPVLSAAVKANYRRLLLIVDELSDSAISLLLANNKPDHMQILAVKTPGYGPEQQAAFLEDGTILCGGRAFVRSAGDTFASICEMDFGHARRVWADLRNFGVIGGKGDARRRRHHVATLRALHAETGDLVLRDKLQDRIGRLLGGSATLRVGGASTSEIKARKELAERTVKAVRGALQEGILPGGGVALLGCRPALQARLDASCIPEERAAYRILLNAVTEPFRTIVANAGYSPSRILVALDHAGPGHVFNALSGNIVPMEMAAIYDPAKIVKGAAYAGLSSAALALTIDVLVHRTEQPSHALPPSPGRRKQL